MHCSHCGSVKHNKRRCQGGDVAFKRGKGTSSMQPPKKKPNKKATTEQGTTFRLGRSSASGSAAQNTSVDGWGEARRKRSARRGRSDGRGSPTRGPTGGRHVAMHQNISHVYIPRGTLHQTFNQAHVGNGGSDPTQN